MAAYHRRSARDAVAVILSGCATLGPASGPGTGQPGPAFWESAERLSWQRIRDGRHTSARSYAIAVAYLFGFTELHLLGNVTAARSPGKCSARSPSTKR